MKLTDTEQNYKANLTAFYAQVELTRRWLEKIATCMEQGTIEVPPHVGGVTLTRLQSSLISQEELIDQWAENEGFYTWHLSKASNAELIETTKTGGKHHGTNQGTIYGSN